MERKQALYNEFSASSKQSCSAQPRNVKTFFHSRLNFLGQSHQFSDCEAIAVLENQDVGTVRIDNGATTNILSENGFVPGNIEKYIGSMLKIFGKNISNNARNCLKGMEI